MKSKSLLFLLAGLLWSALAAQAADPIRVFIRAGEKTHAPGAHEHPQFLADWKPLLESRGVVCNGALEFPTKKQLANTDVLILNSKEAGNIYGEERENLNTFLKRGGGLVVLHAGAVSRDPDWYKAIIGGSWRHGTTKFLEAPMSLYFTNVENPITKDVSNFDLEDEIYYDMDILPEAKILATAYTPKAIDTKGKGNQEAQRRAAEAVAKNKAVNIYDIQPQIWTYENSLKGGRPYRSFVHIPGHWHKNFSHIGVRAMILRGIAWAAKRDDVDMLCKADELGESLRYVEGGVPHPTKLPDHLEVHPDFQLTLVASEPLINNPMNINWDHQGRLWVAETPEYPNGLRKQNVVPWMDSGSLKPGDYDRDPLDRISILTDTDRDGVMDTKKVFADKLELVNSFVFHKNGVIAASAPDIWLLEDTNGDDVADERTKLYTNLGIRDTHAVINNLHYGADGWVYATNGYSSSPNVTSGDGSKDFGAINSGVVRFKPDGSAFEQYASRGGNTWGMDTTMAGEVFYTQPTTGNPLVHVVLPESVLAKGKLPGVSGTNGLLPGAKTFPAMEWEQQAYVQIDQVGRYTAGAGCVIYEGGAWPEKWNQSYFTSEPTLNIIGHFNVAKDGVSYRATKEAGREETEFIRSDNLWFRPIEVMTGPDGAIYLVDFCNQAIIHNDTRGPVHGPANAAVRPDRDHYYGRIWKVQHKQAQAVGPVSLNPNDIVALQKASQSKNERIRDTANRLLRERHGDEGEFIGSDALRSFEKASESNPAQIVAQAKAAQDDWTRSALVAAASDRAVSVLQATLKTAPNASLLAFTSALTPAALANNKAAANAARLLKACGSAASDVAVTKGIILRGLAEGIETPPALTSALKAVIASLLKDESVNTLVLPMAVKWDQKGDLEGQTKALTTALLGKLNQGILSEEQRATIARSLVSIRKNNQQILPALKNILNGTGSDTLKEGVLAAIGEVSGPDLGTLLINYFIAQDGSLKLKTFDQIVKRSKWAQELLKYMSEGKVLPADVGPGNLSRLRNHPDRNTYRAAYRILAKIAPEIAEKDDLIAKLIPEMEKPGDPVKGKVVFGACIVCHKLGDTGAAVGPALDGMGTHGAPELLGQIIDPNREVEDSYWAHNITTKSGETFAGVISSENTSTLVLATQAGVKEIAKSTIAKRENTKRSLMPEGFEALGAENLRNLIAFLVREASEPAVAQKPTPKPKAKILNRRVIPPPIPATPVRWERGKTSVLIIGGGSSHKFHEFFGKSDSKTLLEAGLTVHYTEDNAQATKELANADVAIISVNRKEFDTPAYRKALMDRVNSGKGVIMLHPGTWYGYKDWPELNAQIVGGGTRGHDKLGPFSVSVVAKRHPIMKGVSANFDVVDELYNMNVGGAPEGANKIKPLLETSVSAKSGEKHAAVWITEHPKARIVGFTLGHDERVHDHPDYQKILVNAAKWVAGR
ncbi:MAG: ThuA domain-containing protein [Opitutaceae bacterium]|nr:ThuA domain-containing protein [Opitutaceae bacterium]